MKRLIIIQTTTPDYRANFYKNIKNVLHDNFELYAGDYYFEKSVKSDSNIEKKSLKNYFLMKRKVLFQIGIWHLLFKDFVIVLEMNPRILSNWIFLIIRRSFKKETVLWGHAWPRNGKTSKSDIVRNLMRLLANKIIVYTNKQKEELQIKMPRKTILAAPNSVVSSKNMETSSLSEEFNLIYVGRLSKPKKPFFLVKVFAKMISELPENVNLIIVGDGVEKEKIVSFIKKEKLERRIILKGHVNDYSILKELYFNSFFSVSPGYVGLSITQSLGFGVPMLISEDENHSPEIEAVIPNKNALFFKTNDEDDFELKLKTAYENKEFWNNQRQGIIEFCKKNYSTDTMSEVFINLVK